MKGATTGSATIQVATIFSIMPDREVLPKSDVLGSIPRPFRDADALMAEISGTRSCLAERESRSTDSRKPRHMQELESKHLLRPDRLHLSKGDQRPVPNPKKLVPFM